MSSISLPERERNELLLLYRTGTDPRLRTRAHILLLLDAGFPWATIASVLFTSPSAIARWKGRFEREGTAALAGRRCGRKRAGAWAWAAVVVAWVLTRRPHEFGFARSRWCCEAAAVVLREDHGVPAGRETVRLMLREAGLVWRRPRPTVRPKDPQREAKLDALRALLRGLPDDEAAVFMGEVDVNLNPKVGCAWMRKGAQAEVETPGNNRKRYLAGSISWRTGRLVLTEGREKEGRGAALFCRHLDDLRRAFRRYRVVHVICDNAGFHKPGKAKAVKEYLAGWGGRVKLHYLPTYAPDCNPVERVWWRLHEAVTRNHRCQTMEELLELTFEWLSARTHFRAKSSVYEPKTESLPLLAGAI